MRNFYRKYFSFRKKHIWRNELLLTDFETLYGQSFELIWHSWLILQTIFVTLRCSQYIFAICLTCLRIKYAL